MEKPFALIIEDDRDIAALFRHILDIAGYHTEIEMHGKEAVNHLHSVQPDDEAPHLYNRSFFTIRLTYSLEQAKQIGHNRFGVLFTELDPIAPLLELFDESLLNEFLHEVARHLKITLRPTDTISRFSEGLFLILLEDIFNDDIPGKIARRVRKELGNYLFEKDSESALQVCVGVVLCSAAYETAEEILADVDLARKLARRGMENVLYHRDVLLMHRSSFTDS